MRTLMCAPFRLDQRRQCYHHVPRVQQHEGENAMRNTINRRRFLHSVCAVAATQTLPSAVRAAMGPDDKFDLLIKGGDVRGPPERE